MAKNKSHDGKVQKKEEKQKTEACIEIIACKRLHDKGFLIGMESLLQAWVDNSARSSIAI